MMNDERPIRDAQRATNLASGRRQPAGDVTAISDATGLRQPDSAGQAPAEGSGLRRRHRGADAPRSPGHGANWPAICASIGAIVLLGIISRVAYAYVEAPYTLGRVIQEATQITLLRVEKVEKQRNLILY